MRHVSRGLVYLLASLATMLTVVALALAMALRQGPVPIAFLEPVLLHVLNENSGRLDVRFTDPALRWSPETRSLELEVRDLAMAVPDRPDLLGAPRAAIDVAIAPLLADRRLVIERLALIEPGMELVRSAEGDFGLRLAGREVVAGEAGEQGAREGLARLLAVLFGGSPELRAAVEIRAFRVEGGSLVVRDEVSGARLAGRGDATLSRGEGLLDVDLRLGQDDGPARIGLVVRQQPVGRFAARIAFEDLAPATLAAFAGRAELAGLALRLDGSLSGQLDAEGELAPVAFELRAGAQAVGYGDLWHEPLAIDALELAGTIDPGAARVEMERIALRADGATAEGSGTLSFDEQGPKVLIEATARDLPARRLIAFWPVKAAPKARSWADENLHDGTIGEGRLTLELAPGARPAARGSFRFRDAIVSFLPGMPPIEKGAGSGTFDPDAFEVAGTAGRLGGLALGKTGLAITGLRGDNEQLALDAEASGPVGSLMILGERLPEELEVRPPVPPERAEGSGTYRLELRRPLATDVPPESTVWRFSGELEGLELRGIEDELDITDGTASFAADRQSVRVQGRARADGVPVELAEWRLWLQDDSRLRSEGTLKARPAIADLERLGAALPDGLAGAIGGAIDAVLEVSTPREGARSVVASLDLGPLELDLPRLGLAKPEGQPGALRARLSGPDAAGILRVEDLDLSLPGARVAGRLQLDAARRRLLGVDLDRLELPAGTGALSAQPLEKGGWALKVLAERIDLEAVLGGGPAEARSRSAPAAPLPPLEVTVEAREVKLHDARLRDLRLDVTRSAEAWREGTLSARLSSGTTVSGSLAPGAGGPAIKLHTRDAGSLLGFLDPRSTYAPGGSFNLEGRIRSEWPALRVAGKVAVRDYTLREAPVLAQLLSMASLTGILNTMQGKGIHFDRARVDYDLEGTTLRLSDGRASGSELGFTFAGTVDGTAQRVDIEGTIVPAYTINRILGKVPIVGRLLRGEEGVGAFAATYSVKGSLASPQIFVNPLSLIVPGFIRDLFGGLPEDGGATTVPPDENFPAGGD